MYKTIGIDVSKLTLDLAIENGEGNYKHLKLNNNNEGFLEILKHLTNGGHCVMESSGPYYLNLAFFLVKNGIEVSIVNPLVIKRYAQVLMSRTKTDKQDAAIILSYAQKHSPVLWKPKDADVIRMQQVLMVIENFEKQLRMNKNLQEASSALPVKDLVTEKELNKESKGLAFKIEKLQSQLMKIAETTYGENLERLQTIPGIGPKLAVNLLIATNNFQNFETSRQLISYIGFSPRIVESGTSVKTRGRISKFGKSRLRKLLYMAGLSAIKYNGHCKAFYIRLKEKGKNGKVALIAVANKLLRQAFAIAKSKSTYSEKNLKIA